jgi:hypothetical protein
MWAYVHVCFISASIVNWNIASVPATQLEEVILFGRNIILLNNPSIFAFKIYFYNEIYGRFEFLRLNSLFNWQNTRVPDLRSLLSEEISCRQRLGLDEDEASLRIILMPSHVNRQYVQVMKKNFTEDSYMWLLHASWQFTLYIIRILDIDIRIFLLKSKCILQSIVIHLAECYCEVVLQCLGERPSVEPLRR